MPTKAQIETQKKLAAKLKKENKEKAAAEKKAAEKTEHKKPARKFDHEKEHNASIEEHLNEIHKAAKTKHFVHFGQVSETKYAK